MRRRLAFTLVEALVALAIALMMSVVAYSLWRFGFVSVGSTIAPQVGLQLASRKAAVDFVREIQQCIEVARPLPGSTLNYFIARDKTNGILTAYLVKNPEDSTAAGVPLYDLYVNHKGFGGDPTTQKKLISRIERLTFTSLSPALLQIHLDLHEQDKTYALLTAVRCRNVLGEGRL